MSRNFELLQQEAASILEPRTILSRPNAKTHDSEARNSFNRVPREEAVGLVRRIQSIFDRLRGFGVGEPHHRNQTLSIPSGPAERRLESSATLASAKARLASTSGGPKLSVYSLVRHL
jgi:hypothetical protein